MARSESDRIACSDARAAGGLSAFEVVAGLPVAMAIVRSDGEIWLANDAADQALQRSAGSLSGLNIDRVLGPLSQLLGGSPDCDRSVSVLTPAGERREVGYSISQIANQHEELYAVVFRNITGSAHLASERSRLVRLASIGAATPTVIHEIKSSLAALTMGLELLAERLVDPESHRQSIALATEAETVARTLDGFGAIGRELRAACAADLAPMLEDVGRVARAKAERHDVQLSFRVGELGPVYLVPAVVHALILHLVENAVNACERGGRVVVGIAVLGGEFQLRVQDNGRGMTVDEVSRCTELFFSNSERGSGIGLALCNGAVEAAAGRLSLQSQPGAGTTATVVVPLTPPVQP